MNNQDNRGEETCSCEYFNKDIITTENCLIHRGNTSTPTETDIEAELLQMFKEKYPLPNVGYDGSDDQFRERKLQYVLIKEIIYRAVVHGKNTFRDLLTHQHTEHAKEMLHIVRHEILSHYQPINGRGDLIKRIEKAIALSKNIKI